MDLPYVNLVLIDLAAIAFWLSLTGFRAPSSIFSFNDRRRCLAGSALELLPYAAPYTSF
jgi:hypothetical protein